MLRKRQKKAPDDQQGPIEDQQQVEVGAQAVVESEDYHELQIHG